MTIFFLKTWGLRSTACLCCFLVLLNLGVPSPKAWSDSSLKPSAEISRADLARDQVDPPFRQIPKSLLEITSIPDLFYPYGKFISDVVIPNETIYFQPGIGLDAKSGMPYDHVRIRMAKGKLGEKGNYTAASKISLSIPYLLGVVTRKPIFEKAKLTAEEAEDLLERALKSLLRYAKENPDYDSFLAWSDIRANGTIAPAWAKVPSLDNGQMSWALAAVSASLSQSNNPKHQQMGAMAQRFLDSQNYIKFYDPQKKLMHGTIQFDPIQKVWTGDKTYYLNDMYEGTLAVLWAVLNRHVPQEAWDNLEVPTAEYITSAGEVITTLKGYRASFHEHWGLIYLPLMKSALAPLYQNYLYTQADYARAHGLPGFLSTSYDANGNYRQMGVPDIASQPVDRSDVSVVFATALAMMISPQVGAKWLKNMLTFRGIMTPYGTVESAAHDGYADIMTADGKGLTVMSASGGVVNEVEAYLKTHDVPGTNISMYAKLIELLQSKYYQMMKKRHQEPIHMPTKPYPVPAQKQIEVHVKGIPRSGEKYRITNHFQAGHLHGKNVRSINQPTLEDDVRPGRDFKFSFDIPAHLPYFDQWAFRGTYMDRVIGVAGMKYLVVSIPANITPLKFDLEVKSDDITLGHATIETMTPAYPSEDGLWKTYVEKVNIIPEADYKPMNYFSVTIHDPSYLFGEYARYGREGEITLREVYLSRHHPFQKESKEDPEESSDEAVASAIGDVEAIQYWRTSHGDLTVTKDEPRNVYQFPGGKGWKGGYLPYISLDKFRFLHIKVRNMSGVCNCFNIELKNEDNQILGKKYPIKLAANNQWYTYEIKIPMDLETPLNYLAFSDPIGKFELSSISFSDVALDKDTGTVITADNNPTLRCVSACKISSS